MPVQNLMTVQTLAPVSVSVEPVSNALHSLYLVQAIESMSGLGAWVQETADAMSEDEWRRHKLVIIGFHYAVLPQRSWSSFPAYLERLKTVDPQSMIEKLQNAYNRMVQLDNEKERMYDWSSALTSADAYLGYLGERFHPQYIDAELEYQAYDYLINPPAMQELIVTHLQHMWERYLAKEWQRVLPMLQDSQRAFQQFDFNQMDRLEAAYQITGQELDKTAQCKKLGHLEHWKFVPNAHAGPYLGVYEQGDTALILFGARLPHGSPVYAPDLSRNEILVRVSALADDSRLRVLRLISEQGELRSQDVMQQLDFSQSAASRHLKQLSATGYLVERRCEGSKCYSLNPQRIEETLQAVRAFLGMG